MRQRQQVGALRHEMHAAEHDVVGRRVARDGLGELPGVAGIVGEPDHFVPLVVVPENHQPIAKRGARGGNAHVHLLVGQPEVGLRQRLPFVQTLLLNLVEHRQECDG